MIVVVESKFHTSTSSTLLASILHGSYIRSQYPSRLRLQVILHIDKLFSWLSLSTSLLHNSASGNNSNQQVLQKYGQIRHRQLHSLLMIAFGVLATLVPFVACRPLVFADKFCPPTPPIKSSTDIGQHFTQSGSPASRTVAADAVPFRQSRYRYLLRRGRSTWQL
jgi:hypothetical protein